VLDDPQPVDNPSEPERNGLTGNRSGAEARGAGWTEERGSEERATERRGKPATQGAPERSGQTLTGIELAREALAQAKADALKRGTLPGMKSKRKAPRPSRERSRGNGDPQMFGSAIRDLLADRGWEQKAAVGGVFGNWQGIVGKELAEHTKPEKFEEGELVVAADSTAWATQLRLLAGTLVRRLNEELGDGTVRRVKVVGPASAPRRPGQWRVRG
jgi:predicted nucleic acid-binding Zn ribbon protein